MKVFIFISILSAILNAIILDCATEEIKSNFTEDELKYIDERTGKEKKTHFFLVYLPIISTWFLVILIIGYKQAVRKVVSKYKAILRKK